MKYPREICNSDAFKCNRYCGYADHNLRVSVSTFRSCAPISITPIPPRASFQLQLSNACRRSAARNFLGLELAVLMTNARAYFTKTSKRKGRATLKRTNFQSGTLNSLAKIVAILSTDYPWQRGWEEWRGSFKLRVSQGWVKTTRPTQSHKFSAV